MIRPLILAGLDPVLSPLVIPILPDIVVMHGCFKEIPFSTQSSLRVFNLLGTMSMNKIAVPTDLGLLP